MANDAFSRGGGKAGSPAMMGEKLRNKLYVAFFAAHIAATILVDMQVLYPVDFVPAPLRAVKDMWVAMSNDFVMAGVPYALGPARPVHLAWIHSFITLEALFQLPMFFLGIWGLIRDHKGIYLPLIIYGASTATTVLPCLCTIWSLYRNPLGTPQTTITDSQLAMLFGAFGPFLVIPLILAIDLSFRCWRTMNAGLEAEEKAKSK